MNIRSRTIISLTLIITVLMLAACNSAQVEFVIQFNSNGGSHVSSIVAEGGSSISMPDDPFKEGFIFAGWYRDVDLEEEFDFDTMPNENLVLYAKWETITFTVTFDGDGGILVDGEDVQTVEKGQSAIAPTYEKTGHTFMGWDVSFDNVTANLVVKAQYQINQYTITFETLDGTSIDSVTIDYGRGLSLYVPEKEGYIFGGWYLEDTFDTPITTVPAFNVTLYAKWNEIEDLIDLVQVGERGTTYTIPTEMFDSGTAQVSGGYFMATNQTTYELWHVVRTWAEANGYHFQNSGREGSQGVIGLLQPTARKHEPVTTVSWRDVVVWLNALSEMTGLEPVYRTPDDAIIRDSRYANGDVVDAAIQTSHDGYRLPTDMEWEMAARWKNDTTSTHGSILVGERYWTPGRYASGATGPAWILSDEETAHAATQEVAWYSANSGGKTQPVGQLMPNHLGIFDMSGNVFEWTYTTSGFGMVLRGGCFGENTPQMRVGGNWFFTNTSYTGNNLGFRIVRNS
ncbi:MAG: hypothetical protein EA375_00280 [Acholeplasmataceae bacterium]|nr:MAG: hypothetical protein EA375_00280 [Acholeplasmataceae bacterium]